MPRPHGAYYKCLADAPIDSAPFRRAMGGLTALRLVDVWAEGNEPPNAGFRAVETAINFTDVDTSERAALRALASAIRDEGRRGGASESRVLLRVREYAEVLWNGADWTLASDACRTIINHAHTPAERAILPLTYDRLGMCLRARGRMDDAMAALETGRSVASVLGDVAGELQLRISEAILENQLGNARAAEVILDEVSHDATVAQLPVLWARAAHDRGVMAFDREDYAGALGLYAHTLDRYDAVGLNRVFADIAIALVEVGCRDDARDVLCILAEDSIEQSQRWAAEVNLMRIAALDGNEQMFEWYRSKLADVQLPARHVAHYQLFIGEACLRFGQRLRARKALERAARAIARGQVGQLEGRLASCQRKLEDMSRRRLTTAGVTEPETQSLGANATDIHPGLRDLVARTSAAAVRWREMAQAMKT